MPPKPPPSFNSGRDIPQISSAPARIMSVYGVNWKRPTSGKMTKAPTPAPADWPTPISGNNRFPCASV